MKRQCKTIVEVLRRRAEEHGDRTAYIFLRDGESEAVRWTYDSLYRQSRRIASAIRTRCKPGDRSLLALPNGPEYAAAFLGSLQSGVIAVPAYPAKRGEGLDRLRVIAGHCGPSLVLTTHAGRQSAASLGAPVLEVDEDLQPGGGALEEPVPEQIAFLQYTSGSTSEPKGVIVQHRHLMANEAAIFEAFDHGDNTVIGGWLPLFHDMGLVGQLLHPLYAGVPGVLFSPSAFLQKPLRWLQVISKYSVTTTGGPNFAYDLCVRRIRPEDCEGIDLSCWRVAFNGSEPVRGETMQAFEDRFGAFGFAGSSWLPCYGLAEATLMVAGGRRQAQARVSCGPPVRGMSVRIVDPETHAAVSPGVTGEIWVSGESVAGGYWNHANHPAFNARVTGESAPYLRTGDLGLLDDWELIVAGRLKDLIILAGRNLYPADLEYSAAQAHPVLAGQSAAAFAIAASGTEELVIAVELPRNGISLEPTVLSAIRKSIVREHQVEPAAICLVEHGAIPKTTSGKIRRSACRDRYESNAWHVIARWDRRETTPAAAPAPDGDRAEAIAATVARALGIDLSEIDMYEPLVSAGLTSLRAVELCHALEAGFGIRVPLPEISQLRAVDLTARLENTGRAPVSPAESPTFRASRNQQALYFEQKLASDSAANHIAVAVEFPPGMPAERLRHAFEILAERHSMLRAAIVAVDGEVFNRISPRIEVPFAIVNAFDLAGPALDRELRLHTNRPFVLENAPLWRVAVFRQRAGTLVHAVFHHIIADLWSLARLHGELEMVLDAGVSIAGAGAGTYEQFVNAQARWLESEPASLSRNYWRAKLSGEIPVLNLPAQRARPARRSGRGARSALSCAPELAAQLRHFSREKAITPFCTLLAAFEGLIQRFTAQTDFLIGTPWMGRTTADTHSVFGYFVNPVVLRADLTGDPSFLELTGRVAGQFSSAMAHADLPFADVVNLVQPERREDRTPLCDVMFVHQQAAGAFEKATAIAMGIGGAAPQTSQRDLTVTTAILGEQLVMMAEYDSDLFEPWFISGLLRRYEQLLSSCLSAPERPVAFAEIWTAENYSPIQPGCSSAAASDATLPERFAMQAALCPEWTAVKCEGQSLTYSELDLRAERLASRLRALGAGPEKLVGVYLERCLDLPVAILAVLKSGAGYLPIDPAYPPDRVAFMLRDAAPCLVVTHQALKSRLESPCAVVCIDLDEPESAATPPPPTAPPLPDNAAYVIYTSGSTGQPKGCPVTHRNVVRLFDSVQPFYQFRNDDVWTMFHSHAFDFSVWEMWGAWLYGGRLIVVPPEITRSPRDFGELLSREHVSILSQTPTAFRSLLQSEGYNAQARWPSIRWIVFGGEALDFRALRAWFDARGVASGRLVNMYGITETTVHVTLRPVTFEDVTGGSGSLIGPPIADLALYILDPNLQLVPRGVPGEFYVGGAGLARGYLHRPDLTAARFVPNPFSRTGGERLYRTGDLGRLTGDGDIEYLGRTDNQVQLRGYRIELGEIEASLEGLAGIRRAVVVARSRTISEAAAAEEPGIVILPYRRYLKHSPSSAVRHTEIQLIAYCVPEASNDWNIQRIREKLAERLPEYMIPSLFFALEHLPLTPSGKVDRSALPDPDGLQLAARKSSPPRTSAERALAEIWRRAIGTDIPGVDDNFFAMGGDSIRALRVVAEAERAGLWVSVQDLYRFQTIRALAEAAVPRQASDNWEPAAQFGLLTAADRARIPAGVEDAYPLARMQSGLLFHSDQHAHSSVYRATFLYRLEGVLDCDAFRQAASHIAARRPILRTSFDLVHYSEPLQLVWSTAEPGVSVNDLRGLDDESRRVALENWFQAERAQDFEITRAPLARFTLHHLTDRAFALGLTCHDAILDGWSTALLIVELLQAYDAICNRRPLQPVAAGTTYSDFVRLERRDLAAPRCRALWERTLADSGPSALPFLRPDTGQPPRLAVVDVSIPVELSGALKRLAREFGVPLKHFLLAAHLRVLQSLTGAADLITGLEMNGRPEHDGGDRSVGQHLNTVPFRQRLPGGTWVELVRETYANEQRILPHRRYPYAEIQRCAGGGAMYDTTFNYTHFHVFRELEEARSFRVVEGYGRELTHYALKTEFNRDAFTDRLHLDIIFDAERLAEDKALSIGEMYRRALIALSDNCDARYDACSLLPEPGALGALERGAGPFVERPPLSLVALCELQRDKSPSAVAVTSAEGFLTYADLHRRANRVAHYLISRGAGPEVCVDVRLERSLDLVVALLAVLKAGAAYVPLDPSYPPQRIRAMAEDAGVAMELTSAELKSAVLEEFPDSDPARRTHELSPAYVLFTSGSTGRPKGAVNTHAGICNRLLWMQEAFRLEDSDRVLQKTPIGFDVSGWEFFWPLICGARLVLAKPGGHTDPGYMAGLIQREQVTTVHFVPSMLHLFLAEPAARSCVTLRRVICSGEELTPDLADSFRRTFDCELYNLYGPTEAAIDVTAWKCSDRDSGRIPIGAPIANTQVLVLDRFGHLCMQGAAGELHIGGMNLARGYAHQPGLTAQRFVPNPYGPSGSRLYRTGDLGRVREDGAIEFLGREDGQVKIRGVRIEIAEIEAALRRCTAVSNCAVEVASGPQGHKQLLAYVTPAAEFDEAGIRRELSASLPAQMIPSRFVPLRDLPLTASGKLDRKRLREPRVEAGDPDLAGLLDQVDRMSDDDARLLLAGMTAGGNRL